MNDDEYPTPRRNQRQGYLSINEMFAFQEQSMKFQREERAIKVSQDTNMSLSNNNPQENPSSTVNPARKARTMKQKSLKRINLALVNIFHLNQSVSFIIKMKLSTIHPLCGPIVIKQYPPFHYFSHLFKNYE